MSCRARRRSPCRPGGSADVTLRLTIKGTKLRNNLMNAGSLGNAIGPLTANEYDGYIVFRRQDHKLTMPWHMLPRKSADVVANAGRHAAAVDATTGLASVKLTTRASATRRSSQYFDAGHEPGSSRRAVAANRSAESRPARGGCQHVPGAGRATCGRDRHGLLWEFAFNMWERKASPVGTFLEVDLDVNGDGVVDYAVLNQDLGGLTALTDGRQVTAVLRLSPTGADPVDAVCFFAENATNTGNTVLRVCGSEMGLTLADVGRPMTATFFATSWYFGGDIDILGPFMITPGGEEFTARRVPGDVLAYQQNGNLTVQQWPLFPGTTPHAGPAGRDHQQRLRPPRTVVVRRRRRKRCCLPRELRKLTRLTSSIQAPAGNRGGLFYRWRQARSTRAMKQPASACRTCSHAPQLVEQHASSALRRTRPRRADKFADATAGWRALRRPAAARAARRETHHPRTPRSARRG